jgi:hypothetical protein
MPDLRLYFLTIITPITLKMVCDVTIQMSQCIILGTHYKTIHYTENFDPVSSSIGENLHVNHPNPFWLALETKWCILLPIIIVI